MTIYRCTVLGNLPSGEVFNFGLHTSDGGAGSIGDMLSAWTDALGDLFNGNGVTTDGIKQYLCENVATATARVASLNSGTGIQTDAVETAAVHAGTDVTAKPLPQEVAVAVTTRGGATNRRDRGRFFLPPLSAATLNDNGLIDTTVLGDLADNAQVFLQSLNTGSKPAVIWHRDLLSFTAITRIDVGNVFDSQRRRRNKLLETRAARTL